jgi:preprotein translocase subunit SecB
MAKKSPQAKVQPAIRMKGFQVIRVELDCPKGYDGSLEHDLKINDFKFGVDFDPEQVNNFAIRFELILNDTGVANRRFSLSVVSLALFESREPISEETRKSDLFIINAPAIAFPYVRSFITTFTASIGMPPVVLPTYNFVHQRNSKPRQ